MVSSYTKQLRASFGGEERHAEPILVHNLTVQKKNEIRMLIIKAGLRPTSTRTSAFSKHIRNLIQQRACAVAQLLFGFEKDTKPITVVLQCAESTTTTDA